MYRPMIIIPHKRGAAETCVCVVHAMARCAAEMNRVSGSTSNLRLVHRSLDQPVCTTRHGTVYRLQQPLGKPLHPSQPPLMAW